LLLFVHPLLLHGTASAEPTCALAAKLPLATTPSLALAVALWMRAAASEVIGVRPPLVLPLLPPLLHWQAASCAVLRSASLCIVQQVACIQVSSGAGSVDLVHSDKLAQVEMAAVKDARVKPCLHEQLQTGSQSTACG
jgi:hypothetical protein